MPFITARTSAVLDDERKAELAHRIGRAVAHVPGKSEAETLVDVQDSCSMWLYGSDAEPVAYVDAALFGTEHRMGYDAFSAEVAHAFTEVAGVDSRRVFVRLSEIGAFSCGGAYFDRRRFA